MKQAVGDPTRTQKLLYALTRMYLASILKLYGFVSGIVSTKIGMRDAPSRLDVQCKMTSMYIFHCFKFFGSKMLFLSLTACAKFNSPWLPRMFELGKLHWSGEASRHHAGILTTYRHVVH
jgi:hypothetical protein